jgi:hypothetical protein
LSTRFLKNKKTGYNLFTTTCLFSLIRQRSCSKR